MRSAFGETFDVPTGYLNTASCGIPPTSAVDAVDQAVTDWRTGNSPPPNLDKDIATARAAFATLIGVPAARVAIGATVSQHVATVAASLPDGARVTTLPGEFTSLTFPFAAQAHRGITITERPAEDLATDSDLIAISVVQSADGAVADLNALKASGVNVLLDVSQAAGWLPLDLDWATWVVGTGYKWLLTPRGIAWLAVHPDQSVVAVSAGWFGGEAPYDTLYGLPLRQAEDARRLDLSPNWLAQTGAAASLSWLAGLDRAEVHAHCVGLANALLTGLGLPEGDSAIVALAGTASLPDFQTTVRAGRTRLGFHAYNTADDVESVLAALRKR